MSSEQVEKEGKKKRKIGDRAVKSGDSSTKINLSAALYRGNVTKND